MELINQFTHWLQTVVNTVFPYFKQGWDIFSDYTYLRAAILIFISFFIAKFISKHIPQLIMKLMQKIKFSLGDKIIKLIQPVIFRVIFLACIGIIANFSELTETQHFIAIASVKSFLIIFILFFIYQVIEVILEYLAYKKVDANETRIIQPATLPLFKNIVLLLLALAGIHQVFGAWNIDMTALLASAGIVGLAVGMASKDTLSDVIAGILILTDAPYRVGDVIQIGSQVGTITSIGIRSTRIITKDNIGITVPNGKMGASEVINESTTDDTSLRIKLPILTAYGVDPETIREIMITAAKETKNVLQDKKIEVILSDFQQYQITFILLCWIPEPELKSSTLSQLRERIYIRFLKDDIPISLPKKHEMAIIEQADGVQQIEITAIPELLQSITIKEMPDRNGTLSIKEIPDLFGSGQARNLRTPLATSKQESKQKPEEQRSNNNES